MVRVKIGRPETYNPPNKNIQIALADGIPTSFANDLWQVDVQYLGAIQGLLSKTAAPEAKGAQRIWVWFKHIDLHFEKGRHQTKFPGSYGISILGGHTKT